MTDNDIRAALIEWATQVFGDEAKALHWLTRKQRGFEGVTPLAYATEHGVAAVQAHLARIEHGIYT